MVRSVVALPTDVGEDFEVYVNGVRQEPDMDFRVEAYALVFDRQLRKDRIAGWRWLLGSVGVGTYRQDDTVDVVYTVNGKTRVAHRLAITTTDDDSPA
jgi:hypothetical protein